MNNLTRKEVIDQVPCTSRLDESTSRFKSVTEFLDHVEMGVRDFVRQMLQGYAEDEFIRFIGAKPYERTPLRQDRRNGTRTRKVETRFGLIDGLRLPRGRKSGTSYSTVLARYRRQDERIDQIVSAMFLRGVSTHKVGKISHLLWGSEVSPAEVSRMNKAVKKELIRFPALVECLEKHLDACLVYMTHPANRWKHIRTTNLIERSFKEVKRRVKVMEQFPTEESCIRILFTLLQAQNEAWEGRPIGHLGNYTS